MVALTHRNCNLSNAKIIHKILELKSVKKSQITFMLPRASL